MSTAERGEGRPHTGTGQTTEHSDGAPTAATGDRRRLGGGRAGTTASGGAGGTKDGSGTPVRGRAAPGTVTEHDRQVLHAALAALPPLSDDQIDGLCDVILNARERWQRPDRRSGYQEAA